MAFSTLLFLFGFLPLSLILYYVVPQRYRAIPLVLSSLVFYAWGHPAYLILLALSLGFNYVTGLEIAYCRDSGRDTAAKVSMIVAVAANLLLLGYYKYFGFLVSNLNLIPGLQLSSPQLSMPLGLSFYTFTVLSYVLDVYMGRAEAQKNFLDYAVYATFFPKMLSGPIVQYKDMAPQLKQRTIAPAKIGAGLNLFLVGLFKKVLLADNLGTIFTELTGLTSMSVGTAWLGMILYSLQLYFDFSGYSDMAIGLGKLFGFEFDKNFDYPYCSGSITEFWRRWHISLGAWFRDYVYIPMGGNRCSTGKVVRNLLVVWLLTGLWHGAAWNFIVWGLWHGAFVLMEKYVLKDAIELVPKPLRILYTVLVSFMGWVWFFSPSLRGALYWFAQMFGAGHMGVFDSTFLYYFRSSLILLVLAAVGCGPLVHTLHQKLVYWRGQRMVYVSLACYVVLLVLCIASMVSATYTSFLYFQF